MEHKENEQFLNSFNYFMFLCYLNILQKVENESISNKIISIQFNTLVGPTKNTSNCYV